ncbi:MAG: hypothetical protein LLG08_04275 [Actinomycetia bacterium]|nr:hypothetical protein [Actinomycetes bacterium]
MDREALIDKLTAQLKEWDAEISKLEAKAESSRTDARASLDRQIEELRSKRASAAQKLDGVQHAGEDAWRELASGAERALDDLKDSVKTAVSKFQ